VRHYVCKYSEVLEATDCSVHGDLQVFNILVGKKPSIETLEQFDDKSADVICDWEMSHCGPRGKDLGFFQAFPLSCALAHSINGDKHAPAENILNFLDTVWEEYATVVMDKWGKSSKEMYSTYRDDVLGFCSLFALGYYHVGFHMNFLPIDEGNVQDLTKVKESIGFLGFSFCTGVLEVTISI
jgi:hypothetical protein